MKTDLIRVHEHAYEVPVHQKDVHRVNISMSKYISLFITFTSSFYSSLCVSPIFSNLDLYNLFL